jgi:flavodoxin I
VHALQIIYASTSGHTEFVVDTLIAYLKKQRKDLTIDKKRAELATPEDLLLGDSLVLASSTWNTGGPEGQLNPHMFALLMDRAAGVDLKGKKVAVIGLGDDRYHFLCQAAMHLEEFVTTHGGMLIKPTLRIINEPYNQEKKIESWGLSLLPSFS